VKKLFPLLAIILFPAYQGLGQTAPPLKLIKSIDMPNVPTGPWMDQLAIDMKGLRLFTTPQAQRSVQVLDLRTGTFLHEISGVGNAHAVLYRPDLDRIYVVEGDSGLVRIYDGRTYQHLQDIQLLKGADCIAYDPATKYLYVTNGGRDENAGYSLVTIVDTASAKVVGDIRIPAKFLEEMALDDSNHRLYINIVDKNEVGVLDTQARKLLTAWPITQGTGNTAIALDEVHHRLFVGCRSSDMRGVIAVFDVQTGKEIKALPIGGWVDYLAVDPQGRRIYAVCGTGYVYVYQQRGPDQYDLVGKMETAVLAKTGLLVPELKRLFVATPQIGSLEQAKVLVFETE
jgi:DNA-binding beta-propeller fold protein YncE